jgi:hypothetical protein
MDERLVTIARFIDTIEAELAKQILDDFGIRAIVTGQNNAYTGVPAALDIELQVVESQAKEACEILQDQQNGKGQE